jgi:hypothetical protein
LYLQELNFLHSPENGKHRTKALHFKCGLEVNLFRQESLLLRLRLKEKEKRDVFKF